MSPLKYIVVHYETLSPIVFGETITHKAVAGDKKVVSAGFVSLDFEKRVAKPYGESLSLELGPDHKTDEWLLTRLFFPPLT